MKSCIIFIAASFALWNPLLALGREFDGDEFSNDTLAYKLELLNHTFLADRPSAFKSRCGRASAQSSEIRVDREDSLGGAISAR